MSQIQRSPFVLALAALVVGLGVSLWQYREAREASGRLAEELAIGEKRNSELETLNGEDLTYRAMLANVLGQSGKSDEAGQITRDLLREAQQHYVSPYLFALCYAGLGNEEEAFAWLQKGYEERSSGVVYMRVDPLLKPLHGDPRFNATLKAMGLDPMAE